MKRLKNLMFTVPVVLVALGSYDTARAQNVTLTVTPPENASFPLNFNNIPQNSVSTSQTVQVSANKNTTVIIQATQGWIILSNSTLNIGTSPTPLNIKVNTAGLPQGSYSGSVTITVSGQTQVQYTFGINLTVTGSSVLSANPSSLSFVAQQGSNTGAASGCPNPTTQGGCVVQITSSASPFTYTISATTTSGNNWLLLSATSGTTGDNGFTVSVNPSGLSAGSYSGTITATAQNDVANDTVTISVTLAVNANSTLSVSPSNPPPFLWQTGTNTNPSPLALSVTATNGPVAYNVTVSPQVSWLVVSPLSGSTNSNVTLTPNPIGAGLVAGTYNTNVTISSGANQVVVPVQLIAAAHPLLQLSNNSLSYTGQFGSNQTPPDQSVQVTASDSSSQGFHFASDSAWLTASATGTNFSTGGNASTPAMLAVRVNPAGLAVNNYTGKILVTPTNGDTYTETITVSFSVSAASSLVAGPANVLFSYQVGQSPPGAQLVSVQSTGQPITFTAATSTSQASNCPNNWLSATASNSSTTPSTLTVGAAVANMTAGTCSGAISLTYNNGGGQSTLSIGVYVAVSANDKPELTVSIPAGFGIETASLGAAAYTKTIALGTTGNGFPDFTAVVPATTGGAWVTASPNVGNAPQNLTVTFSPSVLTTPGTYTGNIQISSTTLPLTFAVPITLTITSNITVAASPTTLTFNEAQGAAVPAAQSVTLTSTGGTASFTSSIQYTQGSGWLQVSPSSGSASGPVQVSILANSLSQGTYNAQITFAFQNSSTPSIVVPVTLVVGPSQTVTVSATSLTFAYQIGGTVPDKQKITVSSTGGPVQFSVGTTITGGGNWLSTDITSGTTASSGGASLAKAVTNTKDINVSVNPSGLAAGTYTGTISITAPGVLPAPLTVSVTLTVTAAPVPTPTVIESAASFTFGVIAPGEIITIKGTALGPASPANGVSFTLNAQGGVDSKLAGVQVMFDTTPGIPIYVSATQINVIVPYEVAGRATTTMTVIFNGISSAPFVLNLKDQAPGFFTSTQNGTGQVAALNQDGTYNGAPGNGFAPARQGTIISVYGTGGGLTQPQGTTGSVTPVPTSASGPFFRFPGPVTATIGGQPATVTFAGAAPGLVSGVFQVNIQVPTGVSGNSLALSVSIGNGSTPAVGTTVAVQ